MNTTERTPVIVSEEVLDGLSAVRESGRLNMLDRTRVADLAGLMGHEATADWIRQYPDLYARGIFEGFETD